MTAVITGAASGIGLALAEALHARGTGLVLADVNAPDLSEVAGRLGATAVPTDVTDPQALVALADEAPGARLVCLNAGILGQDLGAPWEVSAEDWDRVFAVNVAGVVNGLRAFVPRLLASGEPAHLLITASLAGAATFPYGGAYGPSKHAVTSLATATAQALADTPVGVTMLCPALVATKMSPEGVPPEEIAAAALRAVDEGRFAVVPEDWQETVVRQRRQLVRGELPEVPPF
ncbi:NAD(P)-dependent dehydrogenase (short-subunit alcohol dehydrogenase family) [Crossiella equi]|uniref:NAD(P)-dependent dehydrogenase (Short-subunit alcohol dehydrogenase family) n=1 Tax=Crossiella equi TaxID=130796 RepID=A0ABS5APC2_9PSEU|nr:SDR family NAD(P)-dependent oxidoreductase [Crossiella equi]MBP2478413.1 NAD(P)-dependent dehydrogenase (short-subunit alcohol dehydrogenase family) [Crossiella equi]